MLKPALVVAALTLLALALLLQFLPPRQLSTPAELALLTANQRVLAKGAIVTERSFSSEKRFVLSSGIEIRFSCQLSASAQCAASLKNKQVSVEGTVQHYQNKTWIKAYTLTQGVQQ
jgi:hypothetical protein